MGISTRPAEGGEKGTEPYGVKLCVIALRWRYVQFVILNKSAANELQFRFVQTVLTVHDEVMESDCGFKWRPFLWSLLDERPSVAVTRIPPCLHTRGSAVHPLVRSLHFPLTGVTH